MKYHIVINSVKTVDELKDAWSNHDIIQLLNRLDFPDAANSKPEELNDLLAMAISDFEPNKAAAILLNYKFHERLSDNQIEQISHEMLLDKISEEYADISFHHELFNVNQLLHKAYNGTFPNAKATIIEFEITPNKEVSKEVALKALSVSLAKSNVIKRLFEDQLAGKEAFDEAEHIAWDLKPTTENGYILITSEYWISRDEFIEAEFDAKIIDFEPEEDE
ncbi:hypothetical protein FPF71_10770 [Algibacter amylolyticus]|uniref:Uncharacterized protein n=1 Tax=Algibacter amylolyticus TaxID=1608400 RepID=A0A5M7B3X7_9FLAO|nr:hypothetical protein [Algibacter amylolyticus]KAA5824089.1 hypothetical protein F2B50_10770 [Algibacter amylolyticus]MBB5269646.1 hypothetical protein [Algibacter amylolyticus]TSJ74566.1 hypothetical protein FPF71_10770 [Algibacter amylolyticus]